MALYIADLWRYPVKSLAGERVSSVAISPTGMHGDRLVRVRGPEGVRTARRHYRLLGLRGTFEDGRTLVSVILLGALVASFCGILYQLTRILLGTARIPRANQAARLDGLPAMGLMLGMLLLFSVWLPGPLFQVMQRAAGIIGGKP